MIDDLNKPHKQISMFGNPFEVKKEIKPIAKKENLTPYIGADPGATGAFAVIVNGEVLETILFPQIKVQSKKPSRTRDKKLKYDKNGEKIFAMIERLDEEELPNTVAGLKERYPDAIVILEKVKNIHGVGAMSNFNFGYNFGYLSALITANRFKKVVLITPQNWQKHVIKPNDKVLTKKFANDTKATSEKALRRLYPELDLRPTPRSSKFHDGLVDAVLIARYGYTKVKDNGKD